MRIIAGKFKGRQIFSSSESFIRPTTDRVREALFSVLGSLIEVKESSVLDLFAGSGALGIEALSRGAKLAVFVDKAPSAIKSISKNLLLPGLEDRAIVIKADVLDSLKEREMGEYIPFDIVFADPPYEQNYVLPVIARLQSERIIKPDSLLVYESLVQKDEMKLPNNVELIKEKRYGSTAIKFFRF